MDPLVHVCGGQGLSAIPSACFFSSFCQEMSMGNVDRCKGFSAHLMKLLIRQRRSLTTLTEQWIILRYVHVLRGLASALWSGLEPREVGRVFLSTTSFDARYFA